MCGSLRIPFIIVRRLLLLLLGYYYYCGNWYEHSQSSEQQPSEQTDNSNSSGNHGNATTTDNNNQYHGTYYQHSSSDNSSSNDKPAANSGIPTDQPPVSYGDQAGSSVSDNYQSRDSNIPSLNTLSSAEDDVIQSTGHVSISLQFNFSFIPAFTINSNIKSQITPPLAVPRASIVS